jgi:hypothetical protein
MAQGQFLAQYRVQNVRLLQLFGPGALAQKFDGRHTSLRMKCETVRVRTCRYCKRQMSACGPSGHSSRLSRCLLVAKADMPGDRTRCPLVVALTIAPDLPPRTRIDVRRR